MQRHYGLRGPDVHRNLFALYRSATNLADVPVNLSYEYLYGPIEDQGQVGTCAAFAPKQLEDAILGKRMKPVLAPLISAAALYSMTKHLREPDSIMEQGLNLEDSLWVLQNVGYVLESAWPYHDTAQYIVKPVPTSLIQTNHDLKGFTRIGGSEMSNDELHAAIQIGLNDLGPLVFGINFQLDWEDTGSDGVMTVDPTQGSAGGHAMNIVGTDGNRRAYLIRNQWGTTWGAAGYGWLSWDCPVQPMDVYAISI